MKRIRKENINTKEYWNAVYKRETEQGILRNDTDRFKLVADEIPKGAKVLDIGCGKGEFYKYLGGDYTGIDIADTPFIVYDGKTIPFPDESFDAVVMMEVLEHIDDIDRLVKEAKRVVKKGGILVGTTPYQNRIESAEHVWSFDLEDIEKLFGLAERINNLIRFKWINT